MTWGFLYLASFLVGLVLAAVTGLVPDLNSLARHRVVVASPDHHKPFLAKVGTRLAVGLIVFGVVGLLWVGGRVKEPRPTLELATVAGILATLGAAVLLRRTRRAPTHGTRATVVRDILPGGYGQVRIERDGLAVVMAAQSDENSLLAAGSEVEVVDSSRSVLTVRMSPKA
ncbi:MAG: hypothetical protein LAO05_05250 [Acidobacteriia bacterium]|nr:hypothetical protein [Terriglobia bacterium]